MSHESRDPDPDAVLDDRLHALPTCDLAPMVARAQLVASMARLQTKAPISSWLERRQSTLLIALSGLHLLWALARVLTLSR